MAHIIHFYKKEKVYEECNDRGIDFHAYVDRDVENYQCSKCGKEVDKNSKFCSYCGVEFSGIKEKYKNTVCTICDSKFKQLAHEDEKFCPRCNRLMRGKFKEEIAKSFYELGKKAKEC